jgi:polar amino acid transport system permease protein
MSLSIARDTAETELRQEQAVSRTKLAHKRHWGEIVASVLVVVVAAFIIHAIVVNKNMQWHVVWSYFGSHVIITALLVTLELSLVSQAIAIVLGILLAAMGQARNPVMRTAQQGYIWLFRGTPLLVQLLFWYNLALLFPNISLGIPFTHLYLFQESTNSVITGFVASILGLALNEGAYMAEIVRSGILAVPKGQLDAGSSLGMRRRRVFRKIVLPQAVRVMIPPTGNQFIGLLKASSLVSVIGGGDLLTRVEYIYGQNFLVIPLLLVASIWYLVLTSLATIGQHFLERALDVEKRGPRSERLGPRWLRNLRPGKEGVSYG